MDSRGLLVEDGNEVADYSRPWIDDNPQNHVPYCNAWHIDRPAQKHVDSSFNQPHVNQQ
jgi:hypothetical protein